DRDASDRGLLNRIRVGDPSALQALMDEYWQPLIRYAERVVGDRDAAEDLVQHSFIRLWDRRREWQPAASARVLLYTIVRNNALNQRKSERTRTRLLHFGRAPRPSRPSTPSELLAAQEVSRAVADAIDELPPRRREVLLLSRYHELSRA